MFPEIYAGIDFEFYFYFNTILGRLPLACDIARAENDFSMRSPQIVNSSQGIVTANLCTWLKKTFNSIIKFSEQYSLPLFFMTYNRQWC